MRLTGDRCERCRHGRPVTYRSKRVGSAIIRYMKCATCRATIKVTVDASQIGRHRFKRKNAKLVPGVLFPPRWRWKIETTDGTCRTKGEKMNMLKHLLNESEVRDLLGLTRHEFVEVKAQGLLPAPAVNVASGDKWSHLELLKWLEQGCPVSQPEAFKVWAEHEQARCLAAAANN